MADPKQGRGCDAAGTAEPIQPRISPAIVALGAVSLLNDIAGDAVQPLLPAFVAMVGGGPVALGVIEGIADATSSLLQIGSGYLADRTRRLKALTFAGYGIANLLRPLLALVGGWWQILVIRFGDRAGKGIRTAPRDALLADAAPPALRGRGYGLHRGMEYIGALLGPAAAYLMLSRGLSVREVFAWTAVPGVLCLLVLGLFVRDIAGRGPVTAAAVGLPPSAVYRRFLMAIFIFTLGSSSDTFLLWRAGEIGIGVALAPVLWMLLHLVKSASSFLGGAMSDRYGRRAPILAGWTLYAAVYLGFAFAAIPWQIWALFACYGFFFGLTESAEKALVVDLVEEQWRGRALGTYHAVIGIASLPASVIFGVLYEIIGPAVAFGMGAAMAVLAALILPRSTTLPGDTRLWRADTTSAPAPTR
jgi:MFS family permease